MTRYAEFDPDGAAGRPLDSARIRPARPEDAESLLRVAATRGGRDAARTDEARARVTAELAGLSDGASWMVFVAEVQGTVVAYARIRDLRHATDGLPEACPEGWYLTGVVVDPAWRRRGLGRRLTQARLGWVRARARHVHYVSNRRNRASIALHAAFGFARLPAVFAYPRAELARGEGMLFRLDLGGGAAGRIAPTTPGP